MASIICKTESVLKACETYLKSKNTNTADDIFNEDHIVELISVCGSLVGVGVADITLELWEFSLIKDYYTKTQTLEG